MTKATKKGVLNYVYTFIHPFAQDDVTQPNIDCTTQFYIEYVSNKGISLLSTDEDPVSINVSFKVFELFMIRREL